MKLTRVAVSVVALLLMGAVAPASGAPPQVKPYQSKTGTIEVGKWIPYNDQPVFAISVTGMEFTLSCDIPTETQGFDAYVFEVPRPYRNIESAIYTKGKGTSLTGEEYHDIDIYIYDASCNLIARYGTSKKDENGFLPKGSAFILLNNYATTASGPATASFRLEPWS